MKHARFSTTKMLLRILRVSWHARPLAVFGYAGGAILETGGFIVSIYATAQVGALLAQYSPNHAATHPIWVWLFTDLVGVACMAVGNWLMSTNKRLLYFRLTEWSINTFHAALSHIDIAEFYDEDTRNMMNKAQSGYTWQLASFSGVTLDLLYSVLRFVATGAIVAQIVWWIIPLLAIFLIPGLLAEKRIATMQWFVWDEKGDDRYVFWGIEWLIRQAKAQMELRSSQARAYITHKTSAMMQRLYRRQEHLFSQANHLLLPARLLETAGAGIGLIVLLRQFLTGAISLDRYFFLSGALLRIGGSLSSIFGTLSQMQEYVLFADNFFAIVDLSPKIVDVPNATQLITARAPHIEFRHVSFCYPNQTAKVVKNLSFSIEPGEHVALVGENGAGKSTIIKLLLRFYRPTEGAILINGIDLQDIAIESWYDQLATLFQEFNQYPFSVRENIEIARPPYAGDDIRLKKAAKQSNVQSFVAKYAHGWDTVLDNSFEKGVEPSGGQWQRVALARAFYRQARVLILDEPTAAIDARAEYDIFNNIFSEYKSKTAIIVSHRFSTVRRAHRIIVLENGSIIEEGTHSKLIKQHGVYQDMFSKQAEGYK